MKRYFKVWHFFVPKSTYPLNLRTDFDELMDTEMVIEKGREIQRSLTMESERERKESKTCRRKMQERSLEPGG